MNKYFILLSFIFAVSNSGAASVLEKAKQKLEETKESVAQPQVAQLQAAQPQAAPPSDANSYCNAIINSTEMKIYTDKYELILNRRSALTRMGVNTSFMQRFLSDSFMRGADDNLRSRSDALVKRIHEAIPSQGESSEDLNKEAIIEKYIAWYALCAAKLKDSSLKYIFLDPSLPPDTINKVYNSSDQ